MCDTHATSPAHGLRWKKWVILVIPSVAASRPRTPRSVTKTCATMKAAVLLNIIGKIQNLKMTESEGSAQIVASLRGLRANTQRYQDVLHACILGSELSPGI